MSQIHEPLSMRQYAKRRGVSAMAVSRAVRAGRLKASVNADGKIIDPELADREWAANTDYTEAPAAVVERAAEINARVTVVAPPEDQDETAATSLPPGLTMGAASTAEKHWKAKLAETKFKREAGELVPASEVRGKLENVFRTCRTKLLGLPSRARQQLPHLTLTDVAQLEGLVREALEELAG